jgi:hypothetical protein
MVAVVMVAVVMVATAVVPAAVVPAAVAGKAPVLREGAAKAKPKRPLSRALKTTSN